jgi:hypothetical protein
VFFAGVTVTFQFKMYLKVCESSSLSLANQLPITSKVLERYNYFRSETKQKTKVRDIFKPVLEELKVLWTTVGIPIQEDHTILTCLVSLHDRLRKFEKRDKSKRQPSRNLKVELRKTERQLNSLFDISSKDCHKQLSRSFNSNWINIWAFLRDQRKRRSKFGHNILSRAVNENVEEQRLQSNSPSLAIVNPLNPTQHLNDAEIVNLIEELDRNEDSSNSSSDESENRDELFIPSDPKQKKRSPLVTIQIPVSNLSRSVTPVSERCGLSIRDQLLVTSSIIVNSGGSTEQFPLSVGTIHRQRKIARRQLSKQIFAKWIQEKPEFPVLHYDAKLINFLSHGKEERLAILISGSPSG